MSIILGFPPYHRSTDSEHVEWARFPLSANPDGDQMITQKQAEELVYEQINRRDPAWPDKPEMIIVRVDEHELGWLVFWDSRLHHETGEFRDTVLGNAPYLVSREDGAMCATGTAPPLEERVREAEFKLRTHLREKRQ